MMKEYPATMIHSRRRDNAKALTERLTVGLTCDDVGTIVEICVSLLIVSAGVATYAISVRLLVLLVDQIAALWLYFSPL